jgi:hypothetical protein
MSETSKLVIGPTFEEMLHPWKIDPQLRAEAKRMMHEDPLDPINLYNITWRKAQCLLGIRTQPCDSPSSVSRPRFSDLQLYTFTLWQNSKSPNTCSSSVLNRFIAD